MRRRLQRELRERQRVKESSGRPNWSEFTVEAERNGAAWKVARERERMRCTAAIDHKLENITAAS